MDIPNLKHLNAVDYLVVVCYLLIVAGVGIYVRKYNKSTQDYFKAGGKLPWLISSLSLFVSGFSAYMFVAASGFVYRNGMVSILVFTSAFGAYWLGYFVYGRLWRRARLDSPMEVLTRRFSQSTTYFYSIIAVIPNILLMGALFYTLSIFISSALGLGKVHIELGHFSLSGFELTLVSIGLILLLYTTLGGLWAVAVTDTIQFIILLLMTLMVFPLSFMQLGNGSFIDGWQNLWQQAPVGYLDWNFENVAIIFLVAFWLMNLMGYNANWHIGQRYYSIADERDTKKMALLCAIFSLIAPILWIMPVLAAKIVFPDLHTIWPELTEPTEASFVSLCLTLLPHGFLGIIVSAMLAASMSSADSTFNWLAAVITKDVYVPIAKSMKKNEEPSDRWQLIVGKTTVLIIGIVAIFVSLSMQKFGSAFDIYLKIYSITVPSLLVPVMLGLIYRKTPWWSAIAASSIAILCTLIANVLANVMAGISVQGIGEIFNELKLSFMGITIGRFEINVFVGTGVSALVFLLSSKWPDKKAEDIKRIIAFDKDLRTPARGDKLHVDVRGIQSYKMIGLLSGLVGLLL
ncbi:MAG: hypothetical protein ACE5HI_18710, partial [bacterium]